VNPGSTIMHKIKALVITPETRDGHKEPIDVAGIPKETPLIAKIMPAVTLDAMSLGSRGHGSRSTAKGTSWIFALQSALLRNLARVTRYLIAIPDQSRRAVRE
jgi:hypothetical protein